MKKTYIAPHAEFVTAAYDGSLMTVDDGNMAFSVMNQNGTQDGGGNGTEGTPIVKGGFADGDAKRWGYDPTWGDSWDDWDD